MAAAGAPETKSEGTQEELPLTRRDFDQFRSELAAKAESDKQAISSELSRTKESLKEALEAKTAEQRKPEEKVYERHELEKMVDDGTISSSTRDDIWQRQQATSQKVEVQELIQAGIQQYKVQDTTDRELALYRDSRPDAFKDGTEDRKLAQEAYDHLIKMGDDAKDPRTDLKALYAAFGPAQKIAERTAVRTPTHVESGGSGSGGSGPPGSTKDGTPKMLQDNPKLKAHYDKRIGHGEYSGYDDPKLMTEMKYAQKRLDRLAAQ